MLKDLYIILALLLWLNVCVSWHYSRGSGLDPLYCRNSGRNIGTMHHEYDSSSICIHECMIKDEIMIPYYLGQPLNKFEGNKLVRASGKVNPTIMYRNELILKSRLLPRGEKDHSPPGDQVWMKDKSKHLRDDNT